jgi:hypothetical protein
MARIVRAAARRADDRDGFMPQRSNSVKLRENPLRKWAALTAGLDLRPNCLIYVQI